MRIDSMRKFIHTTLLAISVSILVALSGCTPDPQTQIANANKYREKGDYKAAIIELKNILQKNPDHADARYLLGATFNDIGDVRSGEQELRRALESGYDRTKVVPALGRSLLTMGEYQKVLDQIRLEGNITDSTQAEVLTLRALASMGLGRIDEGRALFNEALAKRPEFSDALLGQARIAVAEGKIPEALRLIDRALASDTKNTDAWLIKGDMAKATGNRAGAEAAYRKVLELNSNNVGARFSLASLFIASRAFDDARKQIDEVRKLVPNSPMASYFEALIELEKKNYPAARAAVQRVLKVAPDHLPTLIMAGAVEVALGSHAQAQSHLTRVLERAPNNLYARKLIIPSLARTGQVQRAIEVLQAGLKQAPEDVGLMVLAGELYMQNNESAKAADYFEKAAKHNPQSADVRTRLARSHLATGETERALVELETAVQLDPNQYQADILLVMSHMSRGNYEGALKAVQTLEKKQPNNPLTYNLKGTIYLGKKDAATARKYFERALEVQATYTPAATNLAQLDLQDKNPGAARRRMEAMLERDKNNVQALIALANLGPRIGATTKEEIDWLERARKVNPGALQPHFMLARLYVRSGDPKKALEILQQVQATHPENPQVLEMLGAAQIAVGEKNLALATFGKLVALQPKSPIALHRLAGAQILNNELTSAASTLRKALTLQPNYRDAQTALVNLELHVGRYAEAMKIAKQAQKQAAKSSFGLILEGDVLMAEKKFSQAITTYETAHKMSKDGSVMHKLHTAYLRGGKSDEGDARLGQWLTESPDDENVRLYAADNYVRRGKYQEAIAQYERLLQKQQDNVVMLNNLAWAYHQVKDPRALDTAERAYKLIPDKAAVGLNAAVADTLGWILVEQGDTKRGLEWLQKAVAAAPKASEIRYHLAQAWFKAGDKSKAREELERLLSSDAKFPQQAEAQKLLIQLRK
jgi:putative PEP-CTERM system TPR-repeat lipoprotein